MSLEVFNIWPDSENHLTDNLFAGHCTNHAVSAVHGDISCIPYQEVVIIRHVVRELNITAVTRSLLFQ